VKKLEDSLKDFMKLEIKALEESNETLGGVLLERRIKETTTLKKLASNSSESNMRETL
jgi:hypothetical protein